MGANGAKIAGNWLKGGAQATAEWLAPRLGDMLEGYMSRSGFQLYAVPPTKQVVVEARTLTQQRELTKMATEVRDNFVSDFDELNRYLSDNQISAIIEEPWRMPMFFGTALEEKVAAQVLNLKKIQPDGIFSDTKWTGKTNAPNDFYNADGYAFDITGNSSSSILKHANRPQVNAVVTYPSIPNNLGYQFIDWYFKQ